jgi:hypothetical protein
MIKKVAGRFIARYNDLVVIAPSFIDAFTTMLQFIFDNRERKVDLFEMTKQINKDYLAENGVKVDENVQAEKRELDSEN